MAERLTALKADCNTACELVRVESREATVWPYFDLQKELLDIRLLNPLRVELRQLNIAIKGSDSQQIGKTVIGVFLRVNVGLRTEAPAAGEVVCDLDDVSIDA